jgi:hypothetical protein
MINVGFLKIKAQKSERIKRHLQAVQVNHKIWKKIVKNNHKKAILTQISRSMKKRMIRLAFKLQKDPR